LLKITEEIVPALKKGSLLFQMEFLDSLNQQIGVLLISITVTSRF
jgi:hypothetical protein